jgi:hypothetical protein
MYGKGSSIPAVLGVTTAAGTTGLLPKTGANMVIELALAIAAGLAVWALAYVANTKFSQR